MLHTHIINGKGEEALQYLIQLKDIQEIWQECIQVSSFFGTILKEPEIYHRVLWDSLIDELAKLIETNETSKETIGVHITKWVLFYQKVNCKTLPEPLTNFATLKSKITPLLSLNVKMTPSGWERFHNILSNNDTDDHDNVLKACGLISYLVGSKRYADCRLLMEYLSRRKSTLGTYTNLDEFLWDACDCYYKQDKRIKTRRFLYEWKKGKDQNGLLWMNAFGLISSQENISLWSEHDEHIFTQVQQMLPNIMNAKHLANDTAKTMDMWEFLNSFIPEGSFNEETEIQKPTELRTIRIKTKSSSSSKRKTSFWDK